MELLQYWWVLLIIVAVAAVVNKNKDDKKDSPPVVTPTPALPPEVDTRTRLLIDTDMGPKGDPDDVQCYIAQASSILQRYNLVGLVSTSVRGHENVSFIENLLSQMEGVSSNYMKPPVYAGMMSETKGSPSGTTEGSNFMAEQIRNSSADNRLEIHIWGQAATFAQALASVQGNLDKLKYVDVYWVANWNRRTDEDSFKYIANYKNHLNLWRDEEAFRGIMRSGDRTKLEALHKTILASPLGNIYKQYPIPEAQYNWKAGDLSLFFFSWNKTFRDQVFIADGGKFKVADGIESERAVAGNAFRDEMVRVVTENVNRWK